MREVQIIDGGFKVGIKYVDGEVFTYAHDDANLALVEQLDGACARSLRLLEMESLDTAISAQARMWSRRRNRDDNADSRELEPFETVCKNSGPGGPRGGWGRAAHYDAKNIWMP